MKAIKIVGALFGLLLISLVAIVIYISTLDPNAYKGMIADKFAAQTGRTLTMDGDIRLTYYPWLGLELNNVTIGNATGFGEAPFLSTEHAMVRVKLMPLLRDQYEIDTVRLHGTTINLAKDANGVSNWADLAKGDAASDNSNAAGLPLAAVILGGVDIQNANLSFDDKSTGTLYNINNMAVSTGELVYGEPIQFNLTLNAKANKPELGADVKLAGTIVYDLDNETFAIAPLLISIWLTRHSPSATCNLTRSARV
jgi:AsmA protein